MKLRLLVLCLGFAISARLHGQTNPTPPSVETLICLRHGEKPPLGLGQLSCAGLNRALALPKVLLTKYPVPQFVFAPDPTQTISEYGGVYAYVRPLATIEPTAIYCGLPVNTQFGFPQIVELEAELQKDAYQNAAIYVVWEHVFLDTFAQDMVKAFGGDPAQVPAWPDSDYDSIFLIRITRNQGQASVTFAIDHEGLNNLSSDCLPIQTGAISPGLRTRPFGFTVTGTPNSVVVIEGSTNLAQPTWFPLATNTLSDGSANFNDPHWTNYPNRFYRLGPP